MLILYIYNTTPSYITIFFILMKILHLKIIFNFIGIMDIAERCLFIVFIISSLKRCFKNNWESDELTSFFLVKSTEKRARTSICVCYIKIPSENFDEIENYDMSMQLLFVLVNNIKENRNLMCESFYLTPRDHSKLLNTIAALAVSSFILTRK